MGGGEGCLKYQKWPKFLVKVANLAGPVIMQQDRMFYNLMFIALSFNTITSCIKNMAMTSLFLISLGGFDGNVGRVILQKCCPFKNFRSIFIRMTDFQF